MGKRLHSEHEFTRRSQFSLEIRQDQQTSGRSKAETSYELFQSTERWNAGGSNALIVISRQDIHQPSNPVLVSKCIWVLPIQNQDAGLFSFAFLLRRNTVTCLMHLWMFSVTRPRSFPTQSTRCVGNQKDTWRYWPIFFTANYIPPRIEFYYSGTSTYFVSWHSIHF